MSADGVRGYGERLRRAREARGLSTRRAATLAGVDRQTLMHVEQGRRPHVRTSTVVRLADAYGVSLDWIWLGEGRREFP